MQRLNLEQFQKLPFDQWHQENDFVFFHLTQFGLSLDTLPIMSPLLKTRLKLEICAQSAPRRPKNEEAADNRKTRLLRPRQCHLSTQIL